MKTKTKALDRVLILLYKNQDVWYTVKEIEEAADISKFSVQKALFTLVDDGVVVKAKVDRKKRVVKDNTLYVYKIRDEVKGKDYIDIILPYV